MVVPMDVDLRVGVRVGVHVGVWLSVWVYLYEYLSVSKCVHEITYLMRSNVSFGITLFVISNPTSVNTEKTNFSKSPGVNFLSNSVFLDSNSRK